MTLKRTTIIPDDPKKAKAIYDDQISKANRTIMVIIGDTETVKKAIPVADREAQKKPFDNAERWVLWAKDHLIVKDTLELILADSKAERSDRDFDQFKCFCLSPVTHKVDGIILKKGRLSSPRIRLSFSKAERHDLSLLNS